jgi:hypothetical protein
MKHIAILAAVALLLAGCADQVNFAEAAVYPQVGFWYGLWHGMILPFAWVVSLFDKDVAIYAIYNNGGWYDFGFILGAAMFWGSGHGAYRYRRYRIYRE